MEKLYSNLHKLYSIQKTLKFELKPVGKTIENIKKEGILEKDNHRSETYKKVKEYCNEYHKLFIEKVLNDFSLVGLNEYYKYYCIEKRDEKQNKEFLDIQSKLRKEISDAFTKNKQYKGLFQKDMVEVYLKQMYKSDKDKLNDIEEFNKFTTYFTGYNKNRQNMYIADEKSTAVAYRLINENLPTFISNMKIYKKFEEKNPEIIKKVYKDLQEYIQVNELNEMFELDYYNDVLTQRGIEIYNLIISGKSEKDNKKIKGLNEYINEYNQINEIKIPKLKELYKQILSDRLGTSFTFDVIENDMELIELLDNYYKEFEKYINKNNKNTFIKFINNIENFDTKKIYLNNDITITNLSQDLCGDWSYITNKISEKYDNENFKKAPKDKEKYSERKKKALKSIKVYSIEECNDLIKEKYDIYEYIKKYIENNNLLEEIYKNYDKYSKIRFKYNNVNKELIKNEKDVTIIKDLLDSMKKIQEFAKVLIPKDKTIEKDDRFYNEFSEYYSILGEIIPIYNKIRNYLTQKPFSTEKIKINFECPTLLEGWDVTKEKGDLGVLLLKDNKYYLGIMNSYCKSIFDEEFANKEEGKNYKKMVYKQLSGINKNLPRIAFAASRIDEFKPSLELMENYKQGKHLKGDNFDIHFCRELIDFFKEVIQKNEDWKMFKINFSDTATYNNISDFYKEVEEQLYCIEYKNYDENYINELVDRGELYLFEIYNKDFSKFSKGNKNLHTLYWNAVFDSRNLKDVVYKLNGNAEIFYRPASLKIQDTAIHKANEPVKNKNPETIKQGREKSIFTYDLIKNKRYTEDKFMFHVPVTMNFKNSRISNINGVINKKIKYLDDIHVIGIDRGERNLIYICVVDGKGKIVYQKSLNEIINEYNDTKYETDYHSLLEKKEKERDFAKKSWKTINSIKELKEGYMSQVIHVIVNLMREYNAIIVLEDLNSGFKNSRIKVEKQVYQKFEKMLIDKLNYLVFKDNEWEQEGGVLNAYQLTNQFESFRKLGKQSGVLFYIPAWCTSKIDPTTGFINLFNIKYENVKKTKEFIDKFNSIRYNKNENYFEFDIDYSKFTDRLNESKKYWTICTYGKRIKTYRNHEKNEQWDSEEIDLTKEFIKLFKAYSIDLFDIKSNLMKMDDKELFEKFMHLFKLTVQIRNSITGGLEDYLISPVKNKYGKFFNTKDGDKNLPLDADANGAYNIARKGLMLINQIKRKKDDELNKIKYDITNKEWLRYAQDEENL